MEMNPVTYSKLFENYIRDPEKTREIGELYEATLEYTLNKKFGDWIPLGEIDTSDLYLEVCSTTPEYRANARLGGLISPTSLHENIRGIQLNDIASRDQNRKKRCKCHGFFTPSLHFEWYNNELVKIKPRLSAEIYVGVVSFDMKIRGNSVRLSASSFKKSGSLKKIYRRVKKNQYESSDLRNIKKCGEELDQMIRENPVQELQILQI